MDYESLCLQRFKKKLLKEEVVAHQISELEGENCSVLKWLALVGCRSFWLNVYVVMRSYVHESAYAFGWTYMLSTECTCCLLNVP